MNTDEVFKVFQKSLMNAVAQSDAPTIPIKFYGRTFTPPNDQKYFELVIIPNDDVGETWGQDITYRGLVRVLLHWQNDDQGIYTPIQTLNSVADYFKKGSTLQVDDFGLKIIKVPKFSGPLEDGKSMTFAFTIEYNSFVNEG